MTAPTQKTEPVSPEEAQHEADRVRRGLELLKTDPGFQLYAGLPLEEQIPLILFKLDQLYVENQPLQQFCLGFIEAQRAAAEKEETRIIAPTPR